MATGSAIADQFLIWIDSTIAGWVTNNPGVAILTINGYCNDSASSMINSVTIGTAINTQQVTETVNKGVTMLTPQQASVAGEGGTGSIAVTVGGGVPYTAVPDQPWITASIAGNTVNWTAEANPDPGGRSGMIRVGGDLGQVQYFTLTQAGSPPPEVKR